mmetsp:Transcript_15044/g.45455  ORF Transcript_15044/g.45455 Transcript_15044/m.45455 type:complete len:249 (+) Transcript_15044:201-947(+)
MIYLHLGGSKTGLVFGICFLLLQLYPDLALWPFRGIIWFVVELLHRNSKTPLMARLLSRVRRERAGVSPAQLYVAGLAPGIIAALALLLARKIRRHGWQRFLYDVFTPAWQREAQVQNRQQASREAHERRFAAVVHELHRLPTELFMPEEELLQLSASDLKERLKVRGTPAPPGAVEKRELVTLLLESSSETTCVICCDDFEQNDVLRRLRCGHVFHLACVDKWSLGATDYSRPVSCAICNQPLVKQQ